MTVEELIGSLERRADEADEIVAHARVGDMYRQVARELRDIGIGPANRMLTTAQVAAISGLRPKTIAARCRRGEYPGAQLTGMVAGEWRIPSTALHTRHVSDDSIRTRLAGVQ
jgi:hypothetical protein